MSNSVRDSERGVHIVRVLSSIGGASKQLIAKLHKYYVYHHHHRHHRSSSRGPAGGAASVSVAAAGQQDCTHRQRRRSTLLSGQTCCLVRSRSLSDQFQQRSAQHALLLPLSCVNAVLLECAGIFVVV